MPGNLEQVAGTIHVLKREKVDSTFLDRILSPPEYYFKKFEAAGRVLQAALQRRDVRYQKEQEIIKDFATYVKELKKNNKNAHEEANEYLIYTDQAADGFRIKATDDDKWKVVAPQWAVKLKEGEKFTPDKAVLGEFADEKKAIKTMIQAEFDAMGEKGYSGEAIEAVKRPRELTNRGFDVMGRRHAENHS